MQRFHHLFGLRRYQKGLFLTAGIRYPVDKKTVAVFYEPVLPGKEAPSGFRIHVLIDITDGGRDKTEWREQLKQNR